MTATALAFDPAVDPALESHGDPVVVVGRRPDLRVIENPNPIGERFQVDDRALTELHRRRRFLALLAATVLVLAIAWAAGVSVLSFPAGAAAPGVGAQAAPQVHVVLPGDTYGAIAAEWGAQDPVAAGRQLRAANGDAELVVGQRLIIDPATVKLAD